MIGKVTWVGHITCAECPEQMTDIPWGWARRELNKAGWKHNGKLWHCPGCTGKCLRLYWQQAVRL